MHRPFRFAAPPPSSTALVRPRLADVLARRFELRLVTLEAAAGLGKTTLLTQAVAAPAASTVDCWLTCEPADASASTFLGALLESLGAPDAGDAPSISHVCEAVWSRSPAQVCLVLDDVHAIAAGTPGSNVVQLLLDDLPENGHIVVSGRWLPDLARTRLRVQGRAIDVTEEELRLNDAESVAFAASRGVDIDVVRGAAGWPALAELHAAMGRIDAERFVWEEVLLHVPEDDRRAFLRLAAVGGAEADTAEAVAGGPFDRALLRSLPLVSSDELGAIKPHPLWVDLLRDRIDPEETTGARRRLAAAMTERGQHGPAFELLAAAGDWDDALAALFDACNDQRTPPWPDQLDRWAGLLPADLASSPERVYLDAMIARARDPWSEIARDRFATSVVMFHERGDIARELTAGVRSAFSAWLRGDVPTIDGFYERISEVHEAGIPMDALLTANRALVADIEGDTTELRERADAISDIEPRLRHFKGLFRAFADLADGAVDQATSDAAVDAATTAIAVTPAAGTGWAATAPAIVAWARGDLAAVLRDPPPDPGPRLSAAERVPALAVAALAAAHVGDVARAVTLLHALDDVAAECGDRDLLAGFRAVAAATIAVAEGCEDDAREILDKGLADRQLSPAGAGRAVRWLPALPFLFHPPSRALLDELPSGASRSRTLSTCRALVEVRAGRRPSVDGLLDDPPALLTSLPAALAVELVVGIASRRPSAMHVGVMSAMADAAPRAVRLALRGLADGDDAAIASTARALLSRVPIAPPHHVRIEVLGRARLLRDGEPVTDADWRRARVRQLVCALASLREVRRDRLGTMLWPEFDEKSVSANLRMTLSYVQNLLEPQRGRGDAPWFLQQDGGVLRLRDVDHLTVDAWELERALHEADVAAAAGATTSELAHLEAALGLWQGDHLDDVAGEDWAEPLREQVRQRFVRAAVRAGELLVAVGRPADAAAAATKALAADAWCEPAIRVQVSAHLAAGDRAAALHAYDAGLRALADLGISPEPETEELGRRLHAASR